MRDTLMFAVGSLVTGLVCLGITWWAFPDWVISNSAPIVGVLTAMVVVSVLLRWIFDPEVSV